MIAILSPGQALAQVFAERMLNSIGVGLAIAFFGGILLRPLRRQTASTRFAVWFSALLLIAALPFFERTSASNAFALSSPAVAAFHLPSHWALGIVIAWALIATLGFAQIALGFLRLRTLRRRCRIVDPTTLTPALQRTLAQSTTTRRVSLLTSDRIRIPAAIGFFRPAIILPSWALTELDAPEIDAILLHELAHLRRWDDWTNLAQQILRALFFFQPAVWFIGRSLSLEREMACDDFALAASSDPAAYARCLVSVAEKTFLRRSLALALAMAGRAHQTARRVARILKADRPASITVCKPALGLIATLSVLCLVSLQHAPNLVQFEPANTNLSASTTGSLSITADSQDPGTKPIPAAFHRPATVAAPPLRRKNIAASANLIRPTPRSSQAREVRASFLGTRASSPQDPGVISAARNLTQRRSLLLVMQTEQFDQFGGLTWSVSIYRVTVFRPTQQVRQEATPKTT